MPDLHVSCFCENYFKFIITGYFSLWKFNSEISMLASSRTYQHLETEAEAAEFCYKLYMPE